MAQAVFRARDTVSSISLHRELSGNECVPLKCDANKTMLEPVVSLLTQLRLQMLSLIRPDAMHHRKSPPM